MSKPTTPVLKEMCGNCPFREGSPYQDLVPTLTDSALNGQSRVCHSTGSNNAIHRRTGKPQAICRGARDIQLKYFAAIGFIEEPTDEAWDKKRKELNV